MNNAALAIVGLVSACMPVRQVALHARPTVGTGSLEVEVQLAGAHDPLRVEGGAVELTALSAALAGALAAANAPWAAAHVRQPPDGWHMLVELTRATAEEHAHTVHVTLGARLTVRERASAIYVGQTQLRCDQSGEPAESVVEQCLERMARDGAAWLSGAME